MPHPAQAPTDRQPPPANDVLEERLQWLQALLDATHSSVIQEEVFDALGAVVHGRIGYDYQQLALFDISKQATVRRITYQGDGFASIENDYQRHSASDPLLQKLQFPLGLAAGFATALPERSFVLDGSQAPASALLPSQPGIHLVLPLVSKRDVIGMWTLSRTVGGSCKGGLQPFSQRERALLEAAAPLIALPLEQLRLLGDGQRLVTRHYLLSQLTLKLRSSLDEAALAHTLCQELSQLLGLQRLAVLLLPESIPLKVRHNGEAPFALPAEAPPLYHYNSHHNKADAFTDQVSASTFALPLLAEQVRPRMRQWQAFSAYHTLHSPLPEGLNLNEGLSALLKQHHVQAMAAIPLQNRQGLLGALFCFDTERQRSWLQEDQELLEAVAEHFTLALTQARLVSQLQEKNTHLQETLVALQEAQVQLVQSEKMAMLGQFTAGIAHEVNTPLGSMLSNNQTLQSIVSQLEPPFERLPQLLPSVRQLLDINKLAGDRIMETVKNLRNFARLDENERRAADVHEGLDSTLLLLRSMLPKHLQLRKHYGENLPLVPCYLGLLNQVFMNLLVNATQAMEGLADPTLTIETAVVDALPALKSMPLPKHPEGTRYARISIGDSGKGIAPEHRSKLFDPGFTTKGRGVGTGLGLALCYRIIEKHEGLIDVESQEGQGSTFHVYLPLV